MDSVDIKSWAYVGRTPVSDEKNTVARSKNALEEKVGPAYSVELSKDGKTKESEKSRVTASSDSNKESSVTEKSSKAQKDLRIAREVIRYQQADRSVRSHEAAYTAAGGAFAGSASFVYTRGPDGNMYVTGGEVSIHAPAGKTPEETIRNMEIVERAALAPADPSPQDLSTASAALMIAARARAQLMSSRGKGGSSAGRPNPTSMEGLIQLLMPESMILSES